MKKIIVSLIVATSVCACASSSSPAPRALFNDEGYVRNLASIPSLADNFQDFDESQLPAAQLDAQDFALLLKADLAFNQGQYAEATVGYSNLAAKYNDPRLVYQAILSLEHTAASAEQLAQLNQLITQLIQLAPNSNVAKLFQIRVALEQGDSKLAIARLEQLTSALPERKRALLVFLATLLGGSDSTSHSDSWHKFSDFVQKKYAVYPEALLLAVVCSSVANDQAQLLSEQARLAQQYPNWEIPLYWSVGILARNQSVDLILALVQQQLQLRTHPSPNLQNLLVGAYLKAGHPEDAYMYTESQLRLRPTAGNLQIDQAIVNYRLGNLAAAQTNLLAAESSMANRDATVNLALATLYAKESQTQQSLNQYQLVAKRSQLLAPVANVAMVHNYLQTKNYAAAAKVIQQSSQFNHLPRREQILLQLAIYTELEEYEPAYRLIEQQIKLYEYDKIFVYYYASLSGLTGRTQQAISWYKKYIKLNPSDAVGYNDLGFILADQTSNYLQALKYAKLAYQLQPNDSAILDTLGWVYYKLGEFAQALPLLQQAYTTTYDPDTAYHLQAVYQALGRSSDAQQVIINPQRNDDSAFKQMMVSHAFLILMYYQFGVDLSQ